MENQGLDIQGLDNQGMENQGMENQGLENQGLENQLRSRESRSGYACNTLIDGYIQWLNACGKGRLFHRAEKYLSCESYLHVTNKQQFSGRYCTGRVVFGKGSGWEVVPCLIFVYMHSTIMHSFHYNYIEH